MSLMRLLALALAALALAPAPAFARKARPDVTAAEDEDDSAEDEADDEDDSDDEDSDDEDDDEDFEKQNLSGKDGGTTKKANPFEKDRFFVDKVDTESTEDKTLIQGSLSSSSFAYTESGGAYGPMLGDNSARFSRMFTEFRLQTDFRHIRGGRWEARIDARARMVNTPENAVGLGTTSVDPTRIQSGFNGTNEYDIRELWVFRPGKRSDIFFGRQWVPDLGAVRFDGLRVDYAKSRKVTLIGFAGLYPLRGSRSITTDYQPLKDNDGNAAGRFVGVGGFGAAYRTTSTYGAIGGVALVPVAGEQPRVFATSTGYYRSGAALDIYHFALVDAVGSQGAGLTNLSVGANYKPSPRLRVTANLNRVDVDTLAVQANAFLAEPDVDPAGIGSTVVQNETYFRRLGTNVGRVGASAGLGELQRFELSTQVAYRHRPGITIPVGAGDTTYKLDKAQGVDVYAAFTDRRSIKNLRLGVDVARSFGIGTVAFQRSEVLAVRTFAARELRNGHGEWEAEVSYASTKDSAAGITCTEIRTCFGSSKGSILSAGGNLYYRFNRDWFALGSLFLSRQTLTTSATGTAMTDPTVTGVTGFLRASYRF